MTKCKRRHNVLFFLSVFLWVYPIYAVWAETPQPSKEMIEADKQKKLEEAVKKEQAEKEEALAREKEKQVERLIKQQQFVENHKRQIQDAINRAQFATAVTVLNKEHFNVNEKIDVDYVLRNGSKRPFLIDGRKFLPTFVVMNAQGKVVFDLKKSEKKSTPKKGDLIWLEPKKTFSPRKVASFSLSKPGEYRVKGSYTFLKPEDEEENPDIWFGTINTYFTSFKILEEKE